MKRRALRVVACGAVVSNGFLAVVCCGVRIWMGGAHQGRLQEPRDIKYNIVNITLPGTPSNLAKEEELWGHDGSH